MKWPLISGLNRASWRTISRYRAQTPCGIPGSSGCRRRGPLKVPPSALEAGGLVGEDARGADIGQVAGKGALQRAVPAASVIDPGGAAQDAQIGAAGKFAVEADAPVAVDAAVHFVLEERPQVLVVVGSLLPLEASDAVAARDGHVLEQAVPPLVAHRAVVGVVEHEPFDDVLSEIDGFRVGGGDHHAVFGFAPCSSSGSPCTAAPPETSRRRRGRPPRSPGPDGSRSGGSGSPAAPPPR